MKKLFLLVLVIGIICSGFTYEKEETEPFELDSLIDYQKKYVGEEIEVCSSSPTKTYMSYKAVTSPSSKQYWFIREELTVDETTGLLLDDENFIAVALGSYFGDIGDRFYFTLDTGVVLPVVIADQKDDRHTNNGCEHLGDSSVIEFVIDTTVAAEFFGRYSNGYILQGNFNNYSLFNGCIAKVEKVTDTLNENYVNYYKAEMDETVNEDIFQYASGY